MTTSGPASAADRPDAQADRLVGSDRVLAVLTELASIPTGASLDLLAAAYRTPLASLEAAVDEILDLGGRSAPSIRTTTESTA